MHIWWALLIIVTSIGASDGAVMSLEGERLALQRLLSRVSSFALGADRVPDLGELARHCASDVLCAARHIVASLGPGATLTRVYHPVTDTIRWVTTRPSVVRVANHGSSRVVVLSHFGRKVMPELPLALGPAADGIVPQEIVARP